MSSRTYVPTLRVLARAVQVYSTRWQAPIEANLTPTQKTAFLAFLACVIELLTELGEQPVNP